MSGQEQFSICKSAAHHHAEHRFRRSPFAGSDLKKNYRPPLQTLFICVEPSKSFFSWCSPFRRVLPMPSRKRMSRTTPPARRTGGRSLGGTQLRRSGRIRTCRRSHPQKGRRGIVRFSIPATIVRRSSTKAKARRAKGGKTEQANNDKSSPVKHNAAHRLCLRKHRSELPIPGQCAKIRENPHMTRTVSCAARNF